MAVISEKLVLLDQFSAAFSKFLNMGRSAAATMQAARIKASPPIVGVPPFVLCSFTYERIFCPAPNFFKRGMSAAQNKKDSVKEARIQIKTGFVIFAFRE